MKIRFCELLAAYLNQMVWIKLRLWHACHGRDELCLGCYHRCRSAPIL